ncbi:MAG: NAD-dependent epimerase/dehydratase family protein, partial [Cetobacterium sp.]
ENRRTIVHVDRLLEETNSIIKTEKEGIFIPRDTKDVSIKEILEYIFKEKNKTKILIKLPKFIINILGIIKPRIVESLYGSLSFREE